MPRGFRLYLPLALAALGVGLILLTWLLPIPLVVDGTLQPVRSLAFTPAGVLGAAGLRPGPYDRISPPARRLLLGNSAVTLTRAAAVTISSPLRGVLVSFPATERIPGNLLGITGLRLFPEDRILVGGSPVDPGKPLPAVPVLNLQLNPAVSLTVIENGSHRTFFSAEPTLGQALQGVGITLGDADSISLPPETPLGNGLVVQVYRAVPLLITADGQEHAIKAAGRTVGDALATAGFPLQDLDYSIPTAAEPLPEDGRIKVVRVHEDVIEEQESIPFERQVTGDPGLELDQSRIAQAGQPGVRVTRTIIRYEDGVEVSRNENETAVLSQPVNEVIAYGSKIVLKTVDTPSGPRQYYRAVTVYATAYSPCRSGTGTCHSGTSYGLPVRRGVIGVTKQWYRLFAGDQVYVPGYGTAVIADIGGGVPGKYWIDLGFTDEEFEPWARNVTLYFLAPAPANVPLVLP